MRLCVKFSSFKNPEKITATATFFPSAVARHLYRIPNPKILPPSRFRRDGKVFLRYRHPVTTIEATRLLEEFRAGKAGRDKVLRAFQSAPVADLGFAQVDTHRALRKGFPEVIFGAGKTAEQVLKIADRLLKHEQRVLITRVTPEQARKLRKKFKLAVHTNWRGASPSRKSRCPGGPGSSR